MVNVNLLLKLNFRQQNLMFVTLLFYIYRRIVAIIKSQNCSSLYNSPYFCSGSQKLFAQLTHSFPDFSLAEYSWNTDRWTLSNNQSIN
jgi:hypothetical protein